jgi:hypothetical protein
VFKEKRVTTGVLGLCPNGVLSRGGHPLTSCCAKGKKAEKFDKIYINLTRFIQKITLLKLSI